MKGQTYLQVLTSCSEKQDAERIGRLLISKKLAACVQILGPATTIYHWKGKIRENKEWLCAAKALEKNYPAIEKLIKQNHSYELPEIIAMPIVRGSREYLNWLKKVP